MLLIAIQMNKVNWLIPMALSNVVGIERYRIKGAGFAEFGEGELEAECTTIDSFEYRDLGLIKLDIEGKEKHALIGAKQTIEKHSPVIVIEMKFNIPEVEAQLEDCGYRMVERTKIDQVWIRRESDSDIHRVG